MVIVSRFTSGETGETEPGLWPALTYFTIGADDISVHAFFNDLFSSGERSSVAKPYCTSLPLREPLPKEAILIVGEGRFGKWALRILSSNEGPAIWVVGRDENALNQTEAPRVSRVSADGITFLVENFALLRPSYTIVPAIPLHLAFEWLKSYGGIGNTLQERIPQGIRRFLPHSWIARDGSLLVSHADFQCPQDCLEPEDTCTVTKRTRGIPLFERLGQMESEDYLVHIIRSRQIAPGVGGYAVQDLLTLLNRVREQPQSKWLVGTACRCHGIVSALPVQNQCSMRINPS